jgi:serine/threonine protein phosphatase 1
VTVRAGPCRNVGSQRFAVLRGARRVWAVGAIHGEATRLRRLHDILGPRLAAGDRLVYLGNFLGRGAEIAAVLDELLQFRAALLALPGAFQCDVAYLRGAQEEMWHKLLELHMATDPAAVVAWMMPRGVDATLRAYGSSEEEASHRARGGPLALARWTNQMRAAVQVRPGHSSLLAAVRRAACTDDGALLFVHAGLDPARPLDAQGDAFWWGTSGFDSIREHYAGFRRIVRGFDPRRRGFIVDEVTATVDGGCGFGGPLVAACFGADGALVDLIEA